MVSKTVVWVSIVSAVSAAAIVTTVLLVVLNNKDSEINENLENFDETVAETKLGKINGSIFYTRLDKQFIGFRGIRYAEAPVGDLRLRVSSQC
jgi:ABC-type Zn2+ transport system substrate-binding protein/surface adhesin